MDEFDHKYSPKQDSRYAFLLLHGIHEGLDSRFMSDIFEACSETNTTLAIDFPYLHRDGGKPTKGLIEEQQVVNEAYEILRRVQLAPVYIIAKSLGGIVASQWIEQRSPEPDVQLAILGYVLHDGVQTAALKDHLQVVIQGENDRFGNSQAIRNELADFEVKAQVIGIPGADHSYRNDKGQPAYEQAAIEQLVRAVL
jgi:predicted alpha/beta-hydrolase family hydrolase